MDTHKLTSTAGPVPSLDDSEEINLQLQCLHFDIDENEASRTKAVASFHQAVNSVKKRMDLVDKNHDTLASETTQCQARLDDKIGRLESALVTHKGEVEIHIATNLESRGNLKQAQTDLQNRLRQLEIDWDNGKIVRDQKRLEDDDRDKQIERHAIRIPAIDGDLCELRRALEYSNENLPPLSSDLDHITSDMETIRESLLSDNERGAQQTKDLQRIRNRLEQINLATDGKVESLERAFQQIKGTKKKFTDRATWTHTGTTRGQAVLPCQGISKCKESSEERENQLKYVTLSTQETRSGLGALRRDLDNLVLKLRSFQDLNEEKAVEPQMAARANGLEILAVLESFLRQSRVILKAFKSAISGMYTIHISVSSKTAGINSNPIADQANRQQVERIRVDLRFNYRAFTLCVLAGIIWHFLIKRSLTTPIDLLKETEDIYMGQPQYY